MATPDVKRKTLARRPLVLGFFVFCAEFCISDETLKLPC